MKISMTCNYLPHHLCAVVALHFTYTFIINPMILYCLGFKEIKKEEKNLVYSVWDLLSFLDTCM